MKVILRSDVPKVGKRGEVRDVAPGYAANFLFPRGLAEVATPAGIKRAEEEVVARELREADEREELVKHLAKLKDVTVVIPAKANDKGHLYEGVGKDTLARALHEQAQMDIAEEHLELPSPLKEVGEHTIPVAVGEKKGAFTAYIERVT